MISIFRAGGRTAGADGRHRTRGIFMLSAAAAAVMLLAGQAAAAVSSAQVPLLPEVTAEMTTADYWVRNDPGADTPLTDARSIASLNRAMLRTEGCMMFDLREYPAVVGADFQDRLYDLAMKDLRTYADKQYFDRNGNVLTEEFVSNTADNCRNPAYAGEHAASYGIAVRRTDLRAFPTDEIITDERGDINFDYVQLSSIRVNEPVVIQSVSRDGLYGFGYTNNCDGWFRMEDIAVCADRPEWLGAWDLPAERTLVVLDNRVYLDESNTDPEVSSLMLTQGTQLELAAAPGTQKMVTNRSRQYNYTVYIPLRTDDGRYTKKPALISMHYDVQAGFPPLTRRNILRTAFNMLGDSYGWGGMLGSEDCSGFVRGVYRCFGLELPRNTTWQAKAPAVRYDLSEMAPEEKKAVLDQLPAGTTLFFSGHEMMYLGNVDGAYYVLSSVSTAADPYGPGLSRMRLRSVVINTLDIRRMNGRSWLESLNAAVIPYLQQ